MAAQFVFPSIWNSSFIFVILTQVLIRGFPFYLKLNFKTSGWKETETERTGWYFVGGLKNWRLKGVVKTIHTPLLRKPVKLFSILESCLLSRHWRRLTRNSVLLFIIRAGDGPFLTCVRFSGDLLSGKRWWCWRVFAEDSEAALWENASILKHGYVYKRRLSSVVSDLEVFCLLRCKYNELLRK